MYTIIFSDQENDFLSLRTVSVLKFPETAHFDLLKVISKRVNSMANKFSNYVPNTSPNEIAIIDLQMVCVRCNLRARVNN
jgi:hypothetical protein